MEGIFKDITKFFTRVVIMTILVLFLGSILNVEIEDWVKIYIPKPSVKIEENVSRETSAKTLYLIEGKESTKADYLKWMNEQKNKKAAKKGKGLKFTGSGRTRSTTKGDISYGNGR